MNWQWDNDEGEFRLDGKGSLDDAVEESLPDEPSYLLLHKVAKDLTAYIALESGVFEDWEAAKSVTNIQRASHRLAEVVMKMPEAYRRETRNGSVQAGYLREPKP